jgi:hypothetical protein
MEMSGNTIEFRYSRSTAALEDGMQFTVEWSDTLLPGSWSGVSDELDTENPGSSEVENRVAVIPAGSSGRRFVHLKIYKP